MAIRAELFFDEQAPVLRADRATKNAPGILRDPDDRPIDAVVLNLSTSGCLVEAAEHLAIGSIVHLGITGVPVTAARVVRQRGRWYGCQFFRQLSDADILIAGELETVHHGQFGTAPPRYGPWSGVLALAAMIVVPWICILSAATILLR